MLLHQSVSACLLSSYKFHRELLCVLEAQLGVVLLNQCYHRLEVGRESLRRGTEICRSRWCSTEILTRLER